MSLEVYLSTFLPALEKGLQATLEPWYQHPARLLATMAVHHFGWEDPQAKRGKRVRPVLLLLTHEAAGGTWQDALPAALAVELVHNFSLIHDDIQDQSTTRRGRPTVWARWGIAQAINAGDALYALAFAQITALDKAFPHAHVVEALRLLAQTCIALVQGQVLDLAFEQREDVTLDEYWTMIHGKTAALLAAAAELGALLANTSAQRRTAFRRFGEYLGLAFQVWDDYLGVWGDPAQTGKSAADDLIARKKTFPVLYGLAQPDSAFARRWYAGPISPEEAPEVARLLAETGAREHTLQTARRLTEEALNALDEAQPRDPAGQALRELAHALVGRQI